MTAYSKNGHWVPTIPNQICIHCSVTYTAHRKGQEFCSKSCAQTHRAKLKAQSTHTERTCPGCQKKWMGAPSNPSRFCSKACIFESGKWEKSLNKTCLCCGKEFKKSPKKVGSYCSRECANTPHQERVKKICVECNSEFSVLASLRNQQTCSAKCRTEYFKRDRSHAWSGGVVQQSGRKYRRIDRDGYEAKYDGEHRLIVAREIGRNLVRGEVVLCLDKDHENMSPNNFFLCPSFKEAGFILSGVVEWPKSSNLNQYRDSGYIRPSVNIVLHEWENGKRLGGKSRHITRHPQADEIIKRRKAGATVKELAKAFDTSNSNMAEVIRQRL